MVVPFMNLFLSMFGSVVQIDRCLSNEYLCLSLLHFLFHTFLHYFFRTHSKIIEVCLFLALQTLKKNCFCATLILTWRALDFPFKQFRELIVLSKTFHWQLSCDCLKLVWFDLSMQVHWNQHRSYPLPSIAPFCLFIVTLVNYHQQHINHYWLALLTIFILKLSCQYHALLFI